VVLVSQDEIHPVIDPALLGVLLMLKTRIGTDRVWVVSQFDLAYSWSMNLPVVPESIRDCRDLTSPILVALILTLSLRDLEASSSSEEITRLDGRDLSHRGHWQAFGPHLAAETQPRDRLDDQRGEDVQVLGSSILKSSPVWFFCQF
jgi:hypothetical protein